MASNINNFNNHLNKIIADSDDTQFKTFAFKISKYLGSVKHDDLVIPLNDVIDLIKYNPQYCKDLIIKKFKKDTDYKIVKDVNDGRKRIYVITRNVFKKIYLKSVEHKKVHNYYSDVIKIHNNYAKSKKEQKLLALSKNQKGVFFLVDENNNTRIANSKNIHRYVLQLCQNKYADYRLDCVILTDEYVWLKREIRSTHYSLKHVSKHDFRFKTYNGNKKLYKYGRQLLDDRINAKATSSSKTSNVSNVDTKADIKDNIISNKKSDDPSLISSLKYLNNMLTLIQIRMNRLLKNNDIYVEAV